MYIEVNLYTVQYIGVILHNVYIIIYRGSPVIWEAFWSISKISDQILHKIIMMYSIL